MGVLYQVWAGLSRGKVKNIPVRYYQGASNKISQPLRG